MNINYKGCLTLAFFASSGLYTPLVLADESKSPDHVSVGASVINTPRYSGADDTTTIFAPVIDIREGFIFANFEKGIGYEIDLPAGLYFQNAFGYSAGRKDEDKDMQYGSDKLKGMGDIKGTMNTSFAFGWHLNDRLSAEINATMPLGESYGVKYSGSLTGILLQTDEDNITLRLSALFGDERYNDTYYGVNRKQSDDSGYAQFKPGGGMYGQAAALSWTHSFSDHWSTTLAGNYTHLNNKVSDSPIVFKDGGFDAIAAVSYTF